MIAWTTRTHGRGPGLLSRAERQRRRDVRRARMARAALHTLITSLAETPTGQLVTTDRIDKQPQTSLSIWRRLLSWIQRLW